MNMEIETFHEAQFIDPTLPVYTRDVDRFRGAIEKYNPPQGFLERVLESMQYVDRKMFVHDLDKLLEVAIEILSDNEYFVVQSKRGKSDVWIYQSLLRRGLPVPTGEIRTMDYDNDDESFDKLQTGLQQVVFDDFAITGGWIGDMVYSNDYLTLPRDTRSAFFLYTTGHARERLTSKQISVYQSGKDIITLEESLEERDLSFLERLPLKLQPEIIEFSESPLFWTWYKVPDNVPSFFTGIEEKGIPPLIRPELFQPPYHNDPHAFIK